MKQLINIAIGFGAMMIADKSGILNKIGVSGMSGMRLKDSWPIKIEVLKNNRLILSIFDSGFSSVEDVKAIVRSRLNNQFEGVVRVTISQNEEGYYKDFNMIIK